MRSWMRAIPAGDLHANVDFARAHATLPRPPALAYLECSLHRVVDEQAAIQNIYPLRTLPATQALSDEPEQSLLGEH